MHEVPRLQVTLLALDDEEALARKNEEVLLRFLGVIHAVRLAGPEDPDVEPHFLETSRLAVEQRVEPELALEPAQVACVDDEPALAGQLEAVFSLLERSLGNHRL